MQPQHSRRNRGNLGILSVMAVLIGVDQLTKTIARTELMHRPRLSYLGDVFRLEYAENSGAFLSLGAGLSDSSRFWILTVAVGVFLLVAIHYLFFQKELDSRSRMALSWMVAGGVSNLIDRLFRAEGRVIDFLNVGIGDLRTGIFNIADMAIMAGLFLFMIGSWNQSKSSQSSNAARP